MNLKENFPRVLKRLLHEKSITVDELSRKSGVTERQIYFLKKGKHVPKLETLSSIAMGFNMELKEMITMLTDNIDPDAVE